VGKRKVTPKDFLVCFREVRQRGIQGDELVDAIAACVRQKVEGVPSLREALKEQLRREWGREKAAGNSA